MPNKATSVYVTVWFRPASSTVGAEISPEEKIELMMVLFGSNADPLDIERWHSQGFNFSVDPSIRWGLLQMYGGPCGVLAPIQALVLKDLIYESKVPVAVDKAVPIEVTNDQAEAALLRTLVHVLQRVAPEAGNLILVFGQDDAQYRKYSFKRDDSDAARAFMLERIEQLRSPLGVILFVYSLLLTRTLELLRSDMDDASQPLVARFGHCNQELVNLLLCGQAVSNTWDGRKVLDGNPADPNAYALKGIPSQCSVGYLSLLEALRYSTVGDFYKTPTFPVWVVGSSSHYTVLFALDAAVVSVSEEERKVKAARRIFNEMDPTNNGFIPRDKLANFLTKLGVMEDPAIVASVVDPDNLGLCLWSNIAEALKTERQQNDSVIARATEWACPACTLLNTGDKDTCDVCETRRPAVAPPRSVSSPTPSTFTLFHFNGIASGTAVPEVVRVRVTIVDECFGPQNQPSGVQSKRGLRDVIQTRWPMAVLEYLDGKDPKII